VIVGPRTVAQLADGLAGIALELPAEHVRRLDRVSRRSLVADGRWAVPPEADGADGPDGAAVPAELLRRHIGRLSAGVSGEIADGYAPDAVVTQPFAPDGLRIVGREALRARFAAAARLPFELQVRDLVVHETAHPDVVVAEYDYDVRNTGSGASATVANVLVARFRDGLIAESHDYHDHRAMAAVLGEGVEAALAPSS
jgi:ketosteroid isomerase-like protein